MPVRPDDVGEATVASPARHVGLVEVDGGGVVVDEEAGRGYAVNQTGALVWRLLDGQASVGELVDDFADAFAADRAEVADNITGIVRLFGQLGLLENVVRDPQSLPIDIEYVDVDECGEPIEPQPAPTFDDRYLAAPPNT